MMTLQDKDCGKGPKKPFAPPAQKLCRLMPSSPNSLEEDTLKISSQEVGTKPNQPKAKLEKKRKKKATSENGQGSDQEKKGKAQYNSQAKKKAPKEGTSFTDAEFEEIVQAVLQKSLQECLGAGSGLDLAEMSCAGPVACTQSDKEPEIASMTVCNDNADGESLIVPHTPEIAPSQKRGVDPEISASTPGQPDPVPAEKKFNKPSLNKRKKAVQNQNVKKFQGELEYIQKDQPKKTVQNYSQIGDQEEEEEAGFGQCVVWVQCSYPSCEKWRRLCGNIDPSVLPDKWSCDQNTDLEYNHCDIPEESWTGHESEVVYASYVPGSLIWAKQYGYPWWPGMVESDPDLGEYFLFASHLDSLPSKYHVTFFGETVSRAWIPVNMLKNFHELSLELTGVKKRRNKDCSQKLGAAVSMARAAEQISIEERVNLFGFRSRYNGFDATEEGKDSMHSEPNSPDSCMDKEEEVESEMQEEGKKDTALRGSKQAKIQAKKPKSAGLADGRHGILQKKTKRSLGGESTAPPTLIMGRKEGQGNSDPHQPSTKKKFKAPQSKSLVTKLSKEIEASRVPQSVAPPAPSRGVHSTVEKERPGHQEPLHWEAEGVSPEEEVSSDLDLEQLLEDIGNEPELRELSQHRDEEDGFTVALFEA